MAGKVDLLKRAKAPQEKPSRERPQNCESSKCVAAKRTPEREHTGKYE